MVIRGLNLPALYLALKNLSQSISVFLLVKLVRGFIQAHFLKDFLHFMLCWGYFKATVCNF